MKTTEESTPIENKSRRDILLGATTVAATLASSTAFSAMDHSNHNMHSNSNEKIIDAALDCIKTGLACNDHCIELLKDGDTSIVKCMDVLAESLAMCTALSQMASYKSSHLPELAKLCISVCEDCEEECRKHEKKHAACKACADSCNDCIKACKKVAA